MQSYKSQIRSSTINGLKDKVSRKNYGKYLLKVNLANLRALKGQIVTFDFPVTAIIGPNGGGKTTILGGCCDRIRVGKATPVLLQERQV
ncbi:ATP-binding protein [Rhodanobacter sp. B04]|uniref:AAA family ATPase n=1 Tax=Rhodanobacter sp. B04 TaxID=1945860 RepID=UPI001C2C017D|nr:ATP-binding protein [Rhodanobacter sp. B04]